MTPKVLVGVATRGFSYHGAPMYAHLAVRDQLRSLGTPSELEIATGPNALANMNQLCKRAVREDWTHLLSFDDDVIPPQDVAQKLLALDVDLASGVVPILSDLGMFSSIFLPYPDGTFNPRGMLPLWPEGIFRAHSTGMCCTLIRTALLRRMSSTGPWFQHLADSDHGEDTEFCSRAQARYGSTLLVDGSVRCAHIKLMNVGELAPYSERMPTYTRQGVTIRPPSDDCFYPFGRPTEPK